MPSVGTKFLVAFLLLLGGCGNSQRHDDHGNPTGLQLGQTLRDDVLARYGEPDRILLEPDEEVWIYDGSNPHGSYLDAAMRMQAAMMLPSTKRSATTTSATTDPVADAKRKAMQEATLSMLRLSLRNQGGPPGRFTFDRKTDRLRSFSGTLPPISFDRVMRSTGSN
jgi:hypothetical protein